MLLLIGGRENSQLSWCSCGQEASEAPRNAQTCTEIRNIPLIKVSEHAYLVFFSSALLLFTLRPPDSTVLLLPSFHFSGLHGTKRTQ